MSEGAAQYQIGEKIGEGGMGAVYRAWDPVLQRHVALKFMRADTPEHEARLLQEARSQAQVIHENVCRVYQVGRSERGCYIAMQLLEAVPLPAVSSQLTLEGKIVLFKQVAEAVHAAHRLGIIHRDLKPSNILVETREDGTRKAWVTDFGLAREAGKPGTTVTGTALGTPQYMSPEQAKGEVSRLDRRADVFSLGATLYELLTGQPPFTGRSHLEVLYRVVNAEPAPPRTLQPSLPAALEAVVLKCLAKKPERRYDSARALADELERYLAGQPVEARPPGFLLRARAWIERHPTIAAALAAVILSSLVAGALGLRERRRAREREQLAARFGEELAQVEGSLRLSALLPLHDTTGEREAARQRMRAIRERARQLGDQSLPAALAAVGRGHLALQETDEARALLQAAWDGGERSPATAAALGLSLGAVYQARLQLLERARDPAPREARAALERELRDPAVLALAQVAGEQRDYAQARLDFYEKRYDAALSGAAQAGRKLPWLYEAQLLEGDVHLLLGDARRDAGGETGALARYRLAEAAYRAAADKARSDVAPQESLCALFAHQLRLRAEGKVTDVASELAQAEAACAQARLIAQGRAEVPLALADSYASAATVLERSGGDPRPLIERSAAAAEEAARLRPELAAAHQQVGTARLLLANQLGNRGLDAGPALAAARAALRKSLELDPSWAPAYGLLASVHRSSALRTLRGHQNADADLAEAVRVLEAAIARWPDHSDLYGRLGAVEMLRAQGQDESGADPTAAFVAAIRALEKALALRDSPIDQATLAQAWLSRANWELEHKRDPRPSLEQAQQAAARGLGQDPRAQLSWLRMGSLWTLRSRYERSLGHDPRPALLESDKAYSRAVEIAPGDANVLSAAARPLMDLAVYEATNHRSPEELRTRALALLERALQIDPKLVSIMRRAAVLEQVSAEWRIEQGQSPLAAFAATQAWLVRALQLAPRDRDAFISLASLHRARGEWRLSRKEPKKARAEFTAGLEAAERALQIDPRSSTAQKLRGKLMTLKPR